MSYKKANKVLPNELVEIIQQYIDGEYIYIPRKETTRKKWGTDTSTRKDLLERNNRIYEDYQNGILVSDLVEKYYLSLKSIQRILLQEKRR
ncbi:CD3324 family protein [[Clostridium] fimetarium]|uniref:Mor transcription activator family protein n=1 Tax=[Clostridium] fimetarium TaxID=99656 RepID=A0A1I0PW96_9FIRM|nr:CD3324 family protein [[Clostridium] fimetarium]SEW18777.1 Mor transcription activator family protein [[Clostridium] fimetarium]